MESIELSQEELRLLQFSLNLLVKNGGLTLGDIDDIHPLNQKLKAKIKPVEQPKEAPVETKN